MNRTGRLPPNIPSGQTLLRPAQSRFPTGRQSPGFARAKSIYIVGGQPLNKSKNRSQRPLFPRLRPAFRLGFLFFDALGFQDELHGIHPLVFGGNKGDGIKVRMIVFAYHPIDFRLHLIRQISGRPGQLRCAPVQFAHAPLKLPGSILHLRNPAVQTSVGFRQLSHTAGVIDQPGMEGAVLL